MAVHTLIRNLVIALLLTCRADAEESAAPSPMPCQRLISEYLPDASLSSAQMISANQPIDLPGHEVISGQPEHCLVQGQVAAHVGADGIRYADRFELRLPRQWTGRLLFQGGGGLDGIMHPALGQQAGFSSGMESALSRGYAVVSSDGGHDEALLPSPGHFGRDPLALADYAYDSTRKVMGVVHPLVERYYGRPIGHRYFMGCSNGGREALVAAQRYPALFDGYIAGDPAFDLTRAMVAEAWNTQVLAALAPAAGDSPSQLSGALTDEDLRTVSDAVLRSCDALDGLRDGQISDPRKCHFDPGVLRCSGHQSHACLNEAKVNALRKLFSGPKDSHGRPLYSDWPYDAGLAGPGWRLWMLGSERQPALNVLIAPQAINGLALAGEKPAIDLLHFDFDSDPKRLEPLATKANATSTDYSHLKQTGGKILIYTGMSDPVFSANDLIRYHNGVVIANGGMKATGSFLRVFLVPGMNHCSDGPALDQFDALEAVQVWVEQNRPPGRIIARGAQFPERTRPLCPYPQAARYVSGDPGRAESFACR